MVTVNESAFEAPDPGFAAVIAMVPALAISDAGTDAVSTVEETNVVTNAVPFQSTTEPVTKPAPVTVSVKLDPPADTLPGDTELIAGAATTR